MTTPTLKAVPCSREDRDSRYPPAEDFKLPGFALWRNNLTALSQYHNLFFIAQIDRIYIFRPHFPTQTTHTKHAYIIDLPVSQHSLPGTIDRFRPHAVNHLVTGDLGNEEILLIACDDGDVLAYRIWEIANLLASRESDDSHDLYKRQTPFSPEPFLLENVGYSAWGLAVHKHARLIAVSSNGHIIHVFVFAITYSEVQVDSPGNSDSFSEDCYSSWSEAAVANFSPMWKQSDDPYNDRATSNLIVTLVAHQANIPNITFHNSDRNGQEVYLASIDIDGQIVLWNVWAGKPSITIPSPAGDLRTYHGIVNTVCS